MALYVEAGRLLLLELVDPQRKQSLHVKRDDEGSRRDLKDFLRLLVFSSSETYDLENVDALGPSPLKNAQCR